MIKLHDIHGSDTDLQHSQLFSAMLKTIDYAIENDGIGLTKTKAFNRKFATWAAEHFGWPEYSTTELLRVSKVLNEEDVLPVIAIHDLMAIMKLGRHIKDRFKLSKKALALRQEPSALFGLLTQTYLFEYNHARTARIDYSAPGSWDVFLNVINVEAETPPVPRKLSAALLFLYFSGGRDRTMIWDIHRNVRRLC